MRLEPSNIIINNLVKSRTFSIKQFNQKVPNQNISKKMTYLDVMALHQYTDAKRLHTDIDMAKLQKLYRKNGDNFIQAAVSFLMDTYKYPPALKPSFSYNGGFDGVMGFVPAENKIYINEDKIAGYSLEKCLVSLRHEFRHFEQFVDILRCAKLRLHVVDFYAKQNIVQQKINELYKIHKQLKPNEEYDALGAYRYFLNYYDKHPQNKELQEKRKIFNNYRQIALKKFGWIMFDTKESKRTEKIFAEHQKQALRPNGLEKFDLIDYQISYGEYDAYLSQKVFENQITENKKCLFSILKRSNKSLLKACISNEKLCKYMSKELKWELKSDAESPINFLHFD